MHRLAWLMSSLCLASCLGATDHALFDDDNAGGPGAANAAGATSSGAQAGTDSGSSSGSAGSGASAGSVNAAGGSSGSGGSSGQPIAGAQSNGGNKGRDHDHILEVHRFSPDTYSAIAAPWVPVGPFEIKDAAIGLGVLRAGWC